MQRVAVFDSGVGGISVLRELVSIMPNENFIYYGDSANAPYGTKSLEEVRQLTCNAARRLLEEDKAKGLVVACNTATSAAVRILREKYPDIPIVGIEPAVKPAVLCKEHPKVLVMATPMTVKQDKLKSLIHQYEKEADIIPLPCPGLMNFIERGDLYGDDLKHYLDELLYEIKDEHVDAVVLGCTHYPFARKLISQALGDNVLLFDGGAGTAREMKRRLAEKGLLNESTQKGSVVFDNSLTGDQREEKIRQCVKLLEIEI